MKLRQRLGIIVAVAAGLPILGLGFLFSEVAARRLEAREQALQAAMAAALAASVGTWVEAQGATLGLLARSFPVGTLGPEERVGLLRLVYRQAPGAGAVVLVGPDGADLAPPQRLVPGQEVGADVDLGGRPRVDDGRLARFRAALPAAAGPGVRVGRPYAPGGEVGVVPLAVAVEGGVLGVELSLAPLLPRLSVAGASAALLDDAGGVFLGGGPWFDARALAPFRDGGATIRYETATGPVRAAAVPVPGTAWSLVLAEPAEVMDGDIQRLRAQVAYLALIAAALATAVGVLLADRVVRPVEDLRAAAVALTARDRGRRVVPAGDDEMQELGRVFNTMAETLERDAALIAENTNRIETFNVHLQETVEARTAELRAAQARLVEAARLAAVGELGAGVAHELNNPLAGILGLAQLLERRGADPAAAPLLASLAAEARRCVALVAHLRALSGAVDGGAEAAVVEWGAMLHEVAALVAGPLRARGVELAVSADGAGCVRAASGVLRPALVQLVLARGAALPDGGRLRLTAGAGGLLRVALDGPRIVDGDDARAASVPLWAARRALADMGATLDAPPAPADWVLRLPAGEA